MEVQHAAARPFYLPKSPKGGHRAAYTLAGGFTLVELLVVMGVIAALILLALPALSSVRKNQQNARCIQNLRQIGGGIQAYAVDFGGKVLPRYLGLHLPPADRPIGSQRAWYSRLYTLGYLRNADIFYCPAFPPYNSQQATTPITSAVGDTYAMRNWMSPGADWDTTNEDHKRLNSIENPANFFLVVDSLWLSWGRQGYGVAPGSADQNIHTRHFGRANALFADGHVEAKPASYFKELGSGSQAAYGTGSDFSVFELEKPE